MEIKVTTEREEAEIVAKFRQADSNILKQTLDECNKLVAEIEKATPKQKKSLEKLLNKKIMSIKQMTKNPLREQVAEIESAMSEVFSTLKGLPGEFTSLFKQ